MKITELSSCYGCSACNSICPTECIRLELNIEGFLQPVVDEQQCIKCNKCDEVCPLFKEIEMSDDIQKSYYGWHNDENIRRLSSSGGIYSSISNYVVQNGGIAFGAIYETESNRVIHSSNKSNNLNLQRKSKYVQSNPMETFKQAKEYCEDGRLVLYSGTPCQIYGLKCFLGKEYDNLITCDFICHGVPSISVYSDYISFLEKKHKSKVESLDFRSKEMGWKKHSLQVKFKNEDCINNFFMLDLYFKGFVIDNLFLNRECYNCRFREKHYSDIVLADFWGVAKFDNSLDDDKGISLVIVNTERGEQIKKTLENVTINDLDWKYSKYVYKSSETHLKSLDKRTDFFKIYPSRGIIKAINKTSEYNHSIQLIKRAVRKLKGLDY